MKLIIVDQSRQVAQAAADMVCQQLAQHPASVLGLPTGATPLALYRELVRRQHQARLDLSQVITFNLDEYLGLGAEHLHSYAYYMRQCLFQPTAMPAAHTHVPNGLAADPAQEARDYEARIQAAGGIDLQLLGIGRNGHIGFNEPGSPLDSRTRVVRLSRSTRAANRQHFPVGDNPPSHAITMGIGTILEAQRILLLATGPRKAAAVAAAVTGPVTPDLPASVLQHHANTILLLDAAAAQALAEDQRAQAHTWPLTAHPWAY